MSVLEIQVLGSPILREPTTTVAQVTDDLRRLLDDMFETMHAANGVGLAAPQVGRRERLAVIEGTFDAWSREWLRRYHQRPETPLPR